MLKRFKNLFIINTKSKYVFWCIWNISFSLFSLFAFEGPVKYIFCAIFMTCMLLESMAWRNYQIYIQYKNFNKYMDDIIADIKNKE